MIPTPEDQVQFLRKIQRLLAEGLFTASYKFALLHTIADLAVEKGDDSGAPLDLDTKDIAAKFVELYWRQCRPFQGLVLQQNTDRQAAIIGHIAKVQPHCGDSLFRLKQAEPSEWSKLVSKVGRVVREMPLDRLQTVGDEKLVFLYEIIDGGARIMLKPGVAYCLRAFHELLRDLVQGAWVRFVQKLNADKLGNITDLGTFLFGQERASLEVYRPILFEVQRGTCLYCRKPLAAWAERNRANQDELRSRLQEAGLPCDCLSSARIARWAYEQTEKANGQVWVMEKVLHHLGPTWRECLSA